MRVPSQVYSTHQQQIARGAQAERQGQTTGNKSVAPSEAHVRVSVSSEATQLAADNTMDVAKVERLRASIESGSFQIDPLRIAQRIVDQE